MLIGRTELSAGDNQLCSIEFSNLTLTVWHCRHLQEGVYHKSISLAPANEIFFALMG